MLKYIVKNFNENIVKNFNKNIVKNFYKNNLFKRSLCNLAFNNNEDLFIEKINYDTKIKYLTTTKQPHYLEKDYDYIEENFFEKLKKLDIICESTGSKCINCNGTGYILNKFLEYDLCRLCNGNGIY